MIEVEPIIDTIGINAWLVLTWMLRVVVVHAPRKLHIVAVYTYVEPTLNRFLEIVEGVEYVVALYFIFRKVFNSAKLPGVFDPTV